MTIPAGDPPMYGSLNILLKLESMLAAIVGNLRFCVNEYKDVVCSYGELVRDGET